MVKNRRKDGDYYWVSAYIKPITKAGAVVAALTFFSGQSLAAQAILLIGAITYALWLHSLRRQLISSVMQPLDKSFTDDLAARSFTDDDLESGRMKYPRPLPRCLPMFRARPRKQKNPVSWRIVGQV